MDSFGVSMVGDGFTMETMETNQQHPGAISWRGNLQHSRLTKTGHGSDRGRARSETLLVRTTANDFTWNAVGYGSL